MAAEWAGLVSSHAKPASGGILLESHFRWLGERGNSLGSLQVPWNRTHRGQGFSWFSKALGFLGNGSIFVNVCGYNVLCSSEGQGDFHLR
ncbi:hypothetical protein TNCV_3787901 [Trichonephila clavipes]|nr:hypothetical protein TNCV_3787901 [Trichonephila clavipes]